MEAEPYPVVHVSPSEKYPDGRSIMLSGPGKRGVIDAALKLDGKLVKLTGALLKRGDLDMIQVPGRRIKEEEGQAVPAVATKSLEKWRLNGEICDGKCYAGAMRPGNGLSHKACANLCLVGGIPPVFVSAGDVEGNSFFLIGDKDGKPLDKKLYDLTAILVEAEGEIEKRGDLMVFKVDVDTVKVK